MRIYIFLALLLPFFCIVLSSEVVSLIPGCTVDEGAGASAACGLLGPTLAFGILGGFVWLLLGLLGLIPVSIIYAWKNRNSTESTPSNYCLRALESDDVKSENNSATPNTPIKWND